MNGHKAFAALTAINEQSYYVKALYYALGRNDADDLVSVDSAQFAELYMKHVANSNGHIINVRDCFDMFGNGETEFKR